MPRLLLRICLACFIIPRYHTMLSVIKLKVALLKTLFDFDTNLFGEMICFESNEFTHIFQDMMGYQ